MAATKRKDNFDYKKLNLKQIEKLAYAGWDVKDISEFFGISVQQFTNVVMENKYGIGDAYNRGTDDSVRRAERALFEKAVGYEHPEVKVFAHKTGKAELGTEEIVVTKVDTIKHYSPDTPALIFYLTNKKRHEWKHRFEIENLAPGNILPDMSNFKFNDLLQLVNGGVNGGVPVKESKIKKNKKKKLVAATKRTNNGKK